MYLHVTTDPLTDLVDRYTGFSLTTAHYGKPLGLWYAPGYEWVKRMDRLKSWDIVQGEGDTVYDPFPKILELYTRVLEGPEIPLIPAGTTPLAGVSGKPHYVYKFPLTAASFESDITKPDETKIFTMTSDTVASFEAQFTPYYLGSLYYKLAGSLYEAMLEKQNVKFEPSEIPVVIEFLRSKGIAADASTLYKFRKYMAQAFVIRELMKLPLPMRLPVEKDRMYAMDVQEIVDTEITAEMIQRRATFRDAKAAGFPRGVTGALYADGFTGHLAMFDRIRTAEYGDFLRNVMSKVWGGIDYDESLFTDPLKQKYPFLPYVELPSGCLWRPKKVLADYTPTPTVVLAIADTQQTADAIASGIEAEYDRVAYKIAKERINTSPERLALVRAEAYRGKYLDPIDPPNPPHPNPPIVDRLFIAGVDTRDNTLFLFKQGNVAMGGRRKQRRTRRKIQKRRRKLTRSRY